MMALFRNNGLTIVLMLLFLGSIVGQWLTGWHFQNEELARHGQPAVSLRQYLADPQFLSTVFENWESEFLQMSAYVVLTACLIQRGSSESNDPDSPPRDADLAAQAEKPGAPRILRAGAAARWLYANSLGLALGLLFVLSFLLHWRFSAEEAAQEAMAHGRTPPTMLEYLADAQLWFESFQNWQSEFLATAVLVVVAIVLRQRGSPESKPVAAPHGQTGND
jgi:hypothetical protein